MSMWITALLPVGGIVVGALLQFAFTRITERDKHVIVLRAQAYADYLRAVALSGHLRSDDDYAEVMRAAADAKARIAVYGTGRAIAALAAFERAGAALTSPTAQEAFIALVAAMRWPRTMVSSLDVRHVLLGNGK
jgi:hypothetical protein